MRSTRALASVVAVAAAVWPFHRVLSGQASQPPAPRFKTGVDVVEVAVLARDSAGKPVTDLTREEITVLEDGVRQPLVAFERVALPARPAAVPPQRPAPVAQDVASNESSAPSRVFVLVLDSNHVAATRVRVVRDSARQFIENYVGPDDYVAVFSPGGIAAATQDFTTDKARLLTAVDQFTGMKMVSAIIEVDREQAAAERGGRGAVAMHGGKDPSDSERSDRALALSGTLEALAAHLERIPGRRKSLLLFSEGVDYNTADVLGQVQRNASDVMRSMSRAIGALMRTNVAVYAIDPRGANLADADLLETPLISQAGMRNALAGRSLSDEQNDSIRTLHSLSDSTGGFAAVNRNDFTGAFDRILDESSSYYVVGYTPQRPAKPGEFRPIEVKVSRPGVKVSARNGYTGRAEPARRVSQPVMSEPPSGFPMPSTRGRGRAPEPVSVPSAPPATAGLAPPLQALLASPLPQPGLPIRLQAVTLGGDGRKIEVRLVVEVLGRSLQFEERGARFNERIELALLTVNESGKASNGTTAAVDLRLTPEDMARVRSTGVRWLSALELPPGRHQLRVAGRAERTGISGMITHDFVVPEGRRRGVDLSGVTLTSVPSVLMITKGKPWLERVLSTPPTAARTFVGGDQIVAAVEVYRAEKGASDATLIARIDKADGSPSVFNERRNIQASGPRSEQVGFPISTEKLPAGRYVLRITLEAAGTDRLERAVPFEVVGR
jgi:VWFA-related protein